MGYSWDEFDCCWWSIEDADDDGGVWWGDETTACESKANPINIPAA